MVKVIWTESAISDLEDIGEFIAKDSVRYAEHTVTELFESTDILETHPNAGKKVPELNNNVIRELIRGSFRIIYHIADESKIEVLSVHRSSRLLRNLYDFEDFVNE